MRALDGLLLGILTFFALTARTTRAARKGKELESGFFTGIETSGVTTSAGVTANDGGILSIRGLVQKAQDRTDDDRVTGELTIETHAFLDPATHCGPLWGTFVLENPGGKWLAGWIGQITAQGVTIYAMGYGVGRYNGQMANWTYTRAGSDPQVPFKIQGFIVKSNHTRPGFQKTIP